MLAQVFSGHTIHITNSSEYFDRGRWCYTSALSDRHFELGEYLGRGKRAVDGRVHYAGNIKLIFSIQFLKVRVCNIWDVFNVQSTINNVNITIKSKTNCPLVYVRHTQVPGYKIILSFATICNMYVVSQAQCFCII